MTEPQNEKKVPGVYNPLTGLLMMIRFRKRILPALEEGRERFGRFGYMRAGPFHLYQVSEPALLHEMFVHQHKIITRPERFKKLVSIFDHGGMLSGEGEAWRKMRRETGDHFAPANFESQVELIGDIARSHIGRWKDAGSIDVRAETGRYAFEVLQKVLLGGHFPDGSDKLRKAMDTLQDNMLRELLSAKPLPATISTAFKGEWRKAQNYFVGLLQQQIDHYRENPPEKKDLLATMIEKADLDGPNAKVNREHLADQMFQFLFAGHETFANASAWAIHSIAREPEILAKMKAEIAGVAGDKPLTMAHIAQLDYTGRVFKEAIRKYPPIYGNIRQAQEDTTLGGYKIKKGSFVSVPVHVLHRDPEWYPEPMKFDPDRFLPENEAKLPRFAYQPFGAGPHLCVGRSLATLEGIVLLAEVVRNYDLAPLPGQSEMPEAKPLVTLTPEPGSRIAVAPASPVMAAHPPKTGANPPPQCPFHRR